MGRRFNFICTFVSALVFWVGVFLNHADAAQPSLAATDLAHVWPGQALHFPADFGAHPLFHTEWWYATGWLDRPGQPPLGFQVTFFRSAPNQGSTGGASVGTTGNPSKFAANQLIIGHVALSDPTLGKLLQQQKTARQGFGLAYAHTGDTDIKLDDWQLKRAADGSYQADVSTPEFALTLQLHPSQAMLLQGDGGYSRKGPQAGQASYYYSEPQLRVTGTLKRNGQASAVTGSAWLDHEWSQQITDKDASGWNWVGANLADGTALMAFQMRSATGAKLWAHAVLRDASGKMTQYAPEQVQFVTRRLWHASRSKAAYPVAVTIELHNNAKSIQFEINPLQEDQEFDARRSIGAAYWEGAVTIMRDGKVLGRGYLEMTGYDKPLRL